MSSRVDFGSRFLRVGPFILLFFFASFARLQPSQLRHDQAPHFCQRRPPSGASAGSGSFASDLSNKTSDLSIGLHYMFVLPQSSWWRYIHGKLMGWQRNDRPSTDLDGFVDTALKLGICFSEILLTFDSREKTPGSAWRLLESSTDAAAYMCIAQQRVQHVVKELRRRCPQTTTDVKISVLDLSDSQIRKTFDHIFTNRSRPKELFKNSFAYTFAAVSMRSRYIMHMDDDVMLGKGSVNSSNSGFMEAASADQTESLMFATFVGKAITVMEADADVLTVHMSSCEKCMNWTEKPAPHTLRTAFRIGYGKWQHFGWEDMMSTQAFLMHSERFRSIYPLEINGVGEPWKFDIESLIMRARRKRRPTGIFVWLTPESSGAQCKVPVNTIGLPGCPEEQWHGALDDSTIRQCVQSIMTDPYYYALCAV
ncbi:unnamed protein product [Durusdinium trenchii]|uniref:Hexosyltransferase n=1 Tax=Durusdinium trenchii TaxID=1381693 RepID=A0ABP0LKQ5_9DINO